MGSASRLSVSLMRLQMWQPQPSRFFSPQEAAPRGSFGQGFRQPDTALDSWLLERSPRDLLRLTHRPAGRQRNHQQGNATHQDADADIETNQPDGTKRPLA